MRARRTMLILDGDPAARRIIWGIFRDDGWGVAEAGALGQALDAVLKRSPQVAIIGNAPPEVPDLTAAGKHASGRLAAIGRLLEADPLLKILALSAAEDRAEAAAAIELGAFDYFTGGVKPDELKVMAGRAFGLYSLEMENRERKAAAASPGRFHGMIGGCREVQEVFGVIRKVASVDMPVIILGESGTGKEMAARAIHMESRRRAGPFTVINCGAIPDGLLEAELFGYEKGAFTGAVEKRTGRIESADGGTLLLDEIGELSLSLQVKLLRFLQEGTIERLGGHATITVDARVISATNRDIRKMVSEGGFRGDLYFRLSGVSLLMPPLRERGGDIQALALELLRRFSGEFKIRPKGLSRSAIESLGGHSWPGNIRELENRIKRAVALSNGKEISPDDLDLAPPPGQGYKTRGDTGLLEAKEELKKRMIRESLLETGGVVSRSASRLGITRQYLTRLMAKYKIFEQ